MLNMTENANDNTTNINGLITSTKTDNTTTDEYHLSNKLQKSCTFDNQENATQSNRTLRKSSRYFSFQELFSECNLEDETDKNDMEQLDSDKSDQNDECLSFYLHSRNENRSNHREIIKCLGTATYYGKPVEKRIADFHCVASTSLEVNTSSLESSDIESEVSLVDSLDDPNSPRQSVALRNKHDDKLVRGDLSVFLPDNSLSQDAVKCKKSSVFFVPITNGDVCNDIKTIADYLPDNLRNKLNKRQQKSEKKKMRFAHTSPCCDTQGYKYIDSNGNNFDDSSSNFHRKGFIDLDNTYDILQCSNRIVKRKQNEKMSNENFMNRNIIYVTAQTKFRATPRQFNKKKSDDYNFNNNRSNSIKSNYPFEIINRNTKNLNKKTVIPELVRSKESKSSNTAYIKKSRIPVLVHHNGKELPIRQIQFQAANRTGVMHIYKEDPKVNQLIANILIDALNKSDMQAEDEEIDDSSTFSVHNHVQGGYEQKFEIITEENLYRTNDNGHRDNINISNSHPSNESLNSVSRNSETLDVASQTEVNTLNQCCKEVNLQISKAVFTVMKNEDVLVTPNGCVIVCMMQKNSDSLSNNTTEGPENFVRQKGETSDNGKKSETKYSSSENAKQIQNDVTTKINGVLQGNQQITSIVQENKLIVHNNSTQLDSSASDTTDNFVLQRHDGTLDTSSDSRTLSREQDQSSSCYTLPVSHMPIRQNKRQSHRRVRNKNTETQETNTTRKSAGWSVTVSGTNTSGNRAPDLEMRIKFPRQRAGSQADSDAKDDQPSRKQSQNNENEKEFYLPPAKLIKGSKSSSAKRIKCGCIPERARNKSFKFLPNLMNTEIQRRTKEYNRIQSKPENESQNVTIMPPLKTTSNLIKDFRPRQTLTSHRRFSLNHKSHLQTHLESVLSNSTELNLRNRVDLPECFSDVLAINGTVISPEKIRKCL